jgi:Cu/Ag efflux pump CusA
VHRPEEAARLGLTPGRVRAATTTLVLGRKVGEIFDEQKVFDVVVRGVEPVRHGPQALRDLRIDAPGGAQVPLGHVASVRVTATPNHVSREAASRKIDVTCNVRGRDLGAVAREIERRVGGLEFERGYHPELLGEYAALRQSRRWLLGLSLLSLVGIFVLLQTEFESTRDAALLFVSLPFALVGGVAAVIATGGVLSLGSLVGFVTVLGIAARNGILLVSHYRHLEREEGVPFGEALVLQGSAERLSPILMTALATGLALLPIALGGSRPGQEIEHPLAVVIVGGLVTSTVLNLFLMPALFLRFARPRASRPER